MIRSLVRALLAPAAIAAAFALAGCNADNVIPTGRAQAPLSAQTIALIESKNMDKGSPILVRVFKEEAELEVWKKNREGDYALLKTYPICKWSGDLGPKKKQGDRQAPEGFYTITPGQMNPNSSYYLAFNTGYPNAYDRSHGYTGSELMVHGDCSSRGCYAMTDTQIVEIYALAREAFFGGQRQFQFEAFPFRMTALNMAKHRNNPNFAFWKMLKEGYDHFEATHQEPKVAVCEKRYVFDAAPREGEGSLNFSSRGKCPAYRLDPAIASMVLEHRRNEQVQMANYIARGVETAKPHVGDGGSNVAFSSAVYQVASAGEAPGALPRVPNPPGTTIPKVGKPSTTVAKKPEPASAPVQQPSAQPVVVASVPVPEPAPLPKEGRAPAERPTTIASLIGNLFKGGSREETTASAPSEPLTTGTPADLRRTNTEMAAKPKQPVDTRAAETRVASAPMKLNARPQRNTEPPKPAVAVAERQPQPAPIAPIRTAQREPEPTPIAPARSTQRAPEPAPIAPIRTTHREPAPIAPTRTVHRQPQPEPVRTAHREPRPAPAAPVRTAQRPTVPEKPRVKRVAQSEAPAREPIMRTAFSSAPPASSNGLLSGAAPVVAAGSFSAR